MARANSGLSDQQLIGIDRTMHDIAIAVVPHNLIRREFVGGFERPAMACVYGDGNKGCASQKRYPG
jgi:hypothetical protein